MTDASDVRAAAVLGRLQGQGRAVLARAPGRVNLIGEHTDYNGLPVLPFAIERDILVAARSRDDGIVEVENVDARFPVRRFQAEPPLTPFPAGDWGNYVQAATQALVTAGMVGPAGATLRVDGIIPQAAGVSSSAALVVASALALVTLADASLDRVALAELLASGERYVGTLSGGMDQAAILLGRPGHAVHLDFFPLRARPVPIPEAAAFVVAHSLTEAPKSGAARGLYNQRVVECRVACALLGRALGRPLERLADVPEPDRVLIDLDDVLPDVASRADLVARFGVSSSDVERLAPAAVTLADPDRFVLRARVRHVLGEAARVAAMERALAVADLAAAGALLDASHASGAADYGTSTPAADALAELGRANGALGARLMGAGFGGAVLLLVERGRDAALVAGLDRQFYRTRPVADARFVVTPSAGASVAHVDCDVAVC